MLLKTDLVHLCTNKRGFYLRCLDAVCHTEQKSVACNISYKKHLIKYTFELKIEDKCPVL